MIEAGTRQYAHRVDRAHPVGDQQTLFERCWAGSELNDETVWTGPVATWGAKVQMKHLRRGGFWLNRWENYSRPSVSVLCPWVYAITCLVVWLFPFTTGQRTVRAFLGRSTSWMNIRLRAEIALAERSLGWEHREAELTTWRLSTLSPTERCTYKPLGRGDACLILRSGPNSAGKSWLKKAWVPVRDWNQGGLGQRLPTSKPAGSTWEDG